MANEHDSEKSEAVSNHEEKSDAKASAEARVREIKGKKEMAEQGEADSAGADAGQEVNREEMDAKARAQARVKEIKRRKEQEEKAAEDSSDDEAEVAQDSEEQMDAKAKAQARVREIKRKKELAAKQQPSEGAGTEEESPSGDAKSAAEARVREIKRKKELAKQAKDGSEQSQDEMDPKARAQARVQEIKRKKELAKKAGAEGSDAGDAKSAAEARVREIKRKKAEAKKAAGGGDTAKDKAKRAAEERVKEIKRKKAGGGEAAGKSEREKKIAAMKAKARAKAGKKAKDAKPEAEREPSANQPLLDRYVKVIRENLGEEVLEDSYINRLAKEVPTLVAKPDTYLKIAQFLRHNEQLAFDYLSEIHGVDFETHMEVYVHLFSFQNKQPVALKAKIDREDPQIDSVTPLWKGADWPEREAYDLLGIQFKGHPNLKRIMMPDDWVGHPLRKDYEPYDVEV
ncbi:MAG TPA: NADH-quinone oxidoreductase subunit C [Bacillales bacterium]|nr:NADH-quinone oxidoreductase subunit C [Bacillales bacterium]